MFEDPLNIIIEHNELIKELFNCDGSDDSKERIKQMIIQIPYPNFLMTLLGKFILCRPKLHDFFNVLKDCIKLRSIKQIILIVFLIIIKVMKTLQLKKSMRFSMNFEMMILKDLI